MDTSVPNPTLVTFLSQSVELSCLYTATNELRVSLPDNIKGLYMSFSNVAVTRKHSKIHGETEKIAKLMVTPLLG